MNFLVPIGAAVTATADWVVKLGDLVLNHVFVWKRSGMAVRCGFTK